MTLILRKEWCWCFQTNQDGTKHRKIHLNIAGKCEKEVDIYLWILQ